MPIYISRGRFTSDAVKGMLARPENREEVVAKLFKSVGGKLIGWYLTFGHHDWMAIGEFPDEKAAASAILAQWRARVQKWRLCYLSRGEPLNRHRMSKRARQSPIRDRKGITLRENPGASANLSVSTSSGPPHIS
jgi:uncharacterized protein with GYD domain